MRPARGRPEPVDLFKAAPSRGPSRRHRTLFAVRRLIVLVLFLSVFAWVGASLWVAAGLGDAPHTVAQVQSQVGAHFEAVTFPARDNLTLKGWLFHATPATGRVIIFVPGHGDTRVTALSLQVSRAMLGNGYDALLYDPRGSGESDGARGTYGSSESRDVLGAYDFLGARGYRPSRIVLFGEDSGGAAVIAAAAQLPAVGAVVTDSTFAALRPVVATTWTHLTHLPGPADWLALHVAAYLGVDTGLDSAAAVRHDPLRAFLFIHSARDDVVDPVNAVTLRTASANPQSELFVVVQGRGHLDTFAEDSQVYTATLLTFCAQQIAGHGG